MKQPLFCTKSLTLFLLLMNSLFVSYIYANEEKFINIVSARQEYLIKPIFEEFTKDTGIKVNYTISFDYTNQDMLNSIKLSGETNEIDAYLASDASDLYKLQQNGILQSIRSRILEHNIPSHLKDPSRQWFGLSMRVRSLIYSTKRIDPSFFKDYKSIGNKRYRHKLALRTSQKIYNKSMIAIMISHYGYEDTKKIISSWIDNLSTAPLQSDIDVIEHIVKGKADIGIVNSYYLAEEQKKQ